jgi:AcrR family transcriptional regulator
VRTAINAKVTPRRPPKKRAYRMGARAVAAEETRLRIEAATVSLFLERYLDAITLEDIAERADVAVQTILRRFGTRDRLIATVATDLNARVAAQRGSAPVGDVDAAVDRLLEEYDSWGETALRALAQEERAPVLRNIIADGRSLQHDWVARTFARELGRRRGDARKRLFASLVAICDVHVWKVLRRDLGLSREETRRALHQMITAQLAPPQR